MTNLRILLVEDNLPLGKSTAKLIERLSQHQVQLTDEPKTIFELCTAGKIDIVINGYQPSWSILGRRRS